MDASIASTTPIFHTGGPTYAPATVMPGGGPPPGGDPDGDDNDDPHRRPFRPALGRSTPPPFQQTGAFKIKEPSTFSGTDKEDVILWTEKMSQYIQAWGMQGHRAMTCIFMSLDGDAAYFLQAEVANITSWNDTLNKIREHYIDEAAVRQVIIDFHALKQTGPLHDYVRKMRHIHVRLRGHFNQETVLQRFLTGLKPEIGRFVHFLRPKTLNKAIKYTFKSDQFEQQPKGH
ncbi:MAG: retrotransposon gag domain-containing protein, partial [Opitutales bacterium]|nr:retrotransposon gag domain-containing protein [Opitutales bacterium]